MDVKKNGNVLTITANEATNVSELKFAFDIDSDYVGATVVYKHSTLQNVVRGRVYNPTQFSLNAVVEPDVKTAATDEEDGDKNLSPEEQVTIVDHVDYKNLYTDGREYTVKGKLMDKETGEPLLVDGQEVTAEKTFVPEKPDGTIPLSFTFKASTLAGKTVVVFEDLLTDNIQVATHSDLTDEGQTVEFDNPKIGTTATNQTDGSKLVDPEKKVAFVDTVAYSNLQIGKKYKVSGVLMDKASGQPLMVDGETVTAETEFTAEAADGTVEVVFEFDASSVAGDLVVFETLERQHSVDGNYRFVTEHKDLDDEGQTIKVTDPKIGTQATNANDGTQIVEPLKEITINDEVSYENLIEGKVYTVTGTLMDKSTGEPLLVDNKKVTASTTFIAGVGEVYKEEAVEAEEVPINLVSGKVNVTFTFAGVKLHNKEVVVFESLTRNETEVAVHADINDEKQTIKFTDPKIGTNATNANDGTKLFDPTEKVTLNDEVSYENLVEGQVYTVTGILMDKKTGRPLSANGKTLTASTSFIAGVGEVSKDKAKDNVTEKKNLVSGKVSVVFTFNGGNLQGREIVVFESLLREDFEIATHADINDGKQTVKFINPLIPSDKSNTYLSKKLPSSSTSVISSDSSLPQTGSSKSGYLTIIGLVLAAFAFAIYYRRKKVS
ncbi:MAG: VaFE repeat-containing surface-anchored protein [Enterococcus avium]|nr:VaFE repeat-containing surface-anchored protein [Enterococcus avium]